MDKYHYKEENLNDYARLSAATKHFKRDELHSLLEFIEDDESI